jgi:hypothetical protein
MVAGAKASGQVGTGDQEGVRRAVACASREQGSWTEYEDEYDSDSEGADGEDAIDMFVLLS